MFVYKGERGINMKKIDGSSSIFNNPEFLKDQFKFNIIFKNLSSYTLELYSDEESYMMCRGSVEYPTWIWTKDNIDISKIDEIESLIRMYLTDEEKTKFTCKKELYDLLVQRGFCELNLDDYFEMGFLMCNKTKEPKKCDGFISLPTEKDKEILTRYWFIDNQEMNGAEPITMEQAASDMEDFLKSGRFYVWRNEAGKIVSMASYGITGQQAKLSHVFTPGEERGKGYAANLIYHMTNDLLTKGYVPLLYTDYNYIPSNKAYINAGYEDLGILINFSCSKEKLKSLK